MALLAVLTLGVALTLTAHAALLLGRAALTSARAEAARFALDATLASRIQAVYRTVAAARGLSAPLPEGVSGRRLHPELLHLSSDSAGRRVEALLWQPDPVVRLLVDSVGIRVGVSPDLATRHRISVVGAEGIPCPVDAVLPVELWSPRPLIGWTEQHPLEFGPLGTDAPRAIAGVTEDGGAAAIRVVYREGDARPDAGRLDGIWWVDGDLVVGAGVELVGRLATSGDLTIETGGVVEGVVRVGGELTIHQGGMLHLAPCAALSRLSAVPWPVLRVRPLALH